MEPIKVVTETSKTLLIKLTPSPKPERLIPGRDPIIQRQGAVAQRLSRPGGALARSHLVDLSAGRVPQVSPLLGHFSSGQKHIA